jgi:L1 cell adhesion molecule like protein
MVEEAEKYKQEDESNKAKIDAKNGLENYCYQMKTSMDNFKEENLSAEDKETLTKKIDEVLAWLEGNQQAEKEEFDAKQKELEAVANPIMMKAYQSGGAPPGAGMPEGGMPDFAGAGAGNGPTVEEVD